MKDGERSTDNQRRTTEEGTRRPRQVLGCMWDPGARQCWLGCLRQDEGLPGALHPSQPQPPGPKLHSPADVDERSSGCEPPLRPAVEGFWSGASAHWTLGRDGVPHWRRRAREHLNRAGLQPSPLVH
ncbi:unnamed protein product [Gadus morhua 'NCC']